MMWTLPILVLMALLLIAMILAHELGTYLHHKAHGRRTKDESSTDEGFILSGMLGLLALLMAFSFSMALDRFEDRRDLMLDEAGALRNLAMTAETIPDPNRAAIQRLLLRYAEARLEVVDKPDDDARWAANAVAARHLAALEAGVRTAVRAEAGEPNAIALVEAFDVVEDSAVRREAMAAAHLPQQVVALLAAYSIIAAAMMGYAVTASGSRQRVASSTLYVLLALSFGVMLDLDRPRSGAIVVAQEPFVDAVGSLAEYGRGRGMR